MTTRAFTFKYIADDFGLDYNDVLIYAWYLKRVRNDVTKMGDWDYWSMAAAYRIQIAFGMNALRMPEFNRKMEEAMQ